MALMTIPVAPSRAFRSWKGLRKHSVASLVAGMAGKSLRVWKQHIIIDTSFAFHYSASCENLLLSNGYIAPYRKQLIK